MFRFLRWLVAPTARVEELAIFFLAALFAIPFAALFGYNLLRAVIQSFGGM